MKWRVELARDAKKELTRLPSAVQKRVARVLLSLETDPFFPVPRSSRIATAGASVLEIIESYFADKAAHEVLVGVIAHRRDVYRR